MRIKRSWSMFLFGAIVFAVIFLGCSIVMINTAVKTEVPGEFIVMAIVLGLLGIGLLIGCIAAFKMLANTNIGKKDDSIVVQYQMEIEGQIQQLSDAQVLKDELINLPGDKGIKITLSPEYFGLMSWKFIKLKGHYISFVQIRKKDKVLEYFIYPAKDVNKVLEPFLEVFREHKAVNTQNLLDMKRYKAVLEYLKLI